MAFDEDVPREVCDKLPEVSKYKPRFFTTTALQQAKVDLTWDETDPDRLEVTEKLNNGKLNEISESDLKNFLAGSSSEEDDEAEEESTEKEEHKRKQHARIKEEEEGESSSEDEEDIRTNGNTGKDDVISKYKALLQDIEQKEKSKKDKDVQMEISWGIDLKEKTDKIIKEKALKSDDKTPFEQYLERRKQKIKEKKLNKKKKGQGLDDSHSDMSDVPSDIDMNDPYFAEEFENPEFKKKKKKSDKQTTKHKNEDMLEKERESNETLKSKEAELELLLMNSDDEREDGKKHFSLKKIQDNESESKSKRKKKRKEQKEKTNEDGFEVNVKDERFSALFTSHHFNIDPTDPHYKKTKNMEVLIQEKLKRKRDNDNTDLETDDNKRKKAKTKGLNNNVELNVLVKSVKRKTEAYSNRK